MIYWVEDHIAYEHNDLFDILGVSHLHIYIYIYIYICVFVLSMDPKALFCVEQEALEHMSTYICVEHEAMEHMKR